MSGAADPDPRFLAWLTVRTASAGEPASLLGVYLVRASAAEFDALVREIKSHDYWATADPLAEDYRTLPEVRPEDVRRELYWLFED